MSIGIAIFTFLLAASLSSCQAATTEQPVATATKPQVIVNYPSRTLHEIVTLTYIIGGESVKRLNHSAAEISCQRRLFHHEAKDERVTHLVSVHHGNQLKILHEMAHPGDVFWIGGTVYRLNVKDVPRRVEKGGWRLIWTDGTKTTYKPVTKEMVLKTLEPGEYRCLAVDTTKREVVLKECSEALPYMCLTRPHHFHG